MPRKHRVRLPFPQLCVSSQLSYITSILFDPRFSLKTVPGFSKQDCRFKTRGMLTDFFWQSFPTSVGRLASPLSMLYILGSLNGKTLMCHTYEWHWQQNDFPLHGRVTGSSPVQGSGTPTATHTQNIEQVRTLKSRTSFPDSAIWCPVTVVTHTAKC